MTMEDVVKGLRNVADWHYGKYEQTHEEDYLNDGDFLTAVANMLKAQEPRVMTLEEVINHNNQTGCVWFEQPTYNAVAAFIRQDDEYTEIISPYILGEPINHGFMINKFYGKAWRCWTSRPTKEQMEAELWQ